MLSHKPGVRVFRCTAVLGLIFFIGLGLPSMSMDADEASVLRKAAGAVEDGMYGEVNKTLEAFLKNGNSEEARVRAQILLSQSYTAQGRFADVLELLKAEPAQTRAPAHRVGLIYWKARVLYEMDRLEEASGLLKQRPPQAESAWQIPAHFLHVRIERAAGRRDAAIQEMVKFDQVHPEHSEAPVNLFELGLLYLESDQQEKGIQTLRSLVGRFPDSRTGLEGKLWLAREVYRAAQPEEAVALLQTLGSNENAPSPLRLEAFLSLAQFFSEEEKFEEAAQMLDQALSLSPPRHEKSLVLSIEAQVRLSLGEESEAVARMHEAVQLMTNQAAASQLQLQMADELLKRGSFELAYEEYQRFLEVFTDGGGRGLATLGKAWSLFGLERYEEAAEYFEQAGALVQDEQVLQESLVKLGDSWFAAEQYERAVETYRQFVSRFPSSGYSVNAQFQLSESLVRLGRREEAIEVLYNIEQITPKENQACLAALRVAELRQNGGQFDRAVEAYERVLETCKNPGVQAQAVLGRASVRYSQGRFYEALEDLDRIGGEFADTPYAEQALAMSVWCHYLSGRDAEALQLAADFIENYADSSLAPQIQFWKAEYRYNREEFKEAETQFTLLANTYPDHDLADDALFWAGRSAFEQKEYLTAVSHYKDLIEGFPESGKRAEARFVQGDALSKLGEFPGAIQAFEEILTQFPDHYLVDEARGRIGDCQFTLGGQDPARYRDSLDAYVMILSRGRADAEMLQQAQYKIGRCYEKLEDTEQAISYYLQAVYGYMDSSHSGHVVSPVWFSRAAFAAADLLEGAGRLKEAANLYKRVVTAQVPAAEDARSRLQKLRLENWWLL